MKLLRTCVMIAVLMVPPTAALAKSRSQPNKQPDDGGVRTTRLTLQQPPIGSGSGLRLLAEPNELTQADAYTLYGQAAQLLSGQTDRDKLWEWARLELDKLPLDDVKQVLDRCEPLRKLLEQAADCSQCNWPAWKPGTAPPMLRAYRSFAWLLAVQARYEMAQKNYEEAVRTLGAGFAMARHLANGPTLMHGMVGNAVAAVMCKQVATHAEQPEAPSLYAALDALPKPFISLEKQIQAELDNLDKDPRFNVMNRWAARRQLRPAHDRVRLLTKRLSRDIAALQCIEALRLHAAAHQGRLPADLSQVTKWTIPDDPLAEQPFDYTCTDGTAILKSPPPKGGSPKEAMRYELAMAETK
jgi:tetratricopeptide (TPR) repeat protein